MLYTQEHDDDGLWYEPADIDDIKAAAKELGFAVVPMEPTEAMKYTASWACGIGGCEKSKELYGKAYKAMIKAAE